MRILVTGASGFIGSRLCPKLAKLDHEVFALERYVTGRYVLGRGNASGKVFADLNDHPAVRKVVREVQPEAIIHLASISPVSYSYDHPLEVLDTNFIATANLAEAALSEVHHFKQFLFASTSETYGNGPIPKKEDTPQDPNSPYSVSKVASEDHLRYMWEAFKFPITILRPFNTFGRTENTHFVVERIIYQMLTGNRVELGDPRPTRDLLYVDDHISAYLACLGNPKAVGETFNFCTGRSVTIKQLAQMTSRICKFKGELRWQQIPSRPLDIMELVGDYSKARRVLGWKPKYTLEEGLELTANSWRATLKERSGAA